MQHLSSDQIYAEINRRIPPEGIAHYLAETLHTSYERNGREYEIKGQGGLYVNDEGRISKPAGGKGAGTYGILGAFIYVQTGKWTATGKEFADILQRTADYVGYTLPAKSAKPSNGNGSSRPAQSAPSHPAINKDCPTQAYSYTDEHGVELYQNCRYETDKDGHPLPTKTFLQRRQTPDGAWVYSTKGIRKVPFHLHNLLAESEIHDTEGEKDALTLEALGIPAISFNIVSEDERKEFAEHCKGKEAFVYEDNDQPGREKALARARFFYYAGCQTVRIIQFDDLSEHSDVTDWIQAGHSLDDLYARIQATPLFSPLHDITIDLFHQPSPRKILMTIDDRNVLSEGTIAGLTAPIGRGKSQFMAILASLVINQDCEPHSRTAFHLTEGERCIYVDTEMTPDDCYEMLQGIWKRTGQRPEFLTPDKQAFRQLTMISLRGIERAQRRVRLLEAMDMPGLKLLLVDGCLDFIGNPNDIDQSSDFADWLYTQASRRNIGVFYTYHGNRNDPTGKGKGWLGAELQRLSVTFLRLDRHPKNPSIRLITSDFENGKIRKANDVGLNLAMTWDNDIHGMTCIPYDVDGIGKLLPNDFLVIAFTQHHTMMMKKSEIVKAYAEIANVTRQAANKQVNKAAETGLLIKVDIGNEIVYRLNADDMNTEDEPVF